MVLIGPTFALINAALHFTVDSITSRATSWLWKWEHERAFFAMIGLDQAIHLTCLAVTYQFMYKGLAQ